MIKPLQEYLNLRESAEYLGIGYSTAREDYPGWARYNCRPAPYGKAKKFKKSDLDRMMMIRQQETVTA